MSTINKSNEIDKKHNDKKSAPSEPSKTIIMYSTNGAGVVNGKVESLKSEVLTTAAIVVTLQEIHNDRKGKIIMLTGFVTFEAIRKEKHGGTLCEIREKLNPKLIEEYNNNFELLVVEVEASNKIIRIITGCGPQENRYESKRRPFS